MSDMEQTGSFRADMVRKAQSAFSAATPGNVELSDADVVHAGLSCLIAQCEGRLIPVDLLEARDSRAFASGLAQACAAMGHEVAGVSVTAEGGYIVHLQGEGGDLTVDKTKSPIPTPFEKAFEENDQ